MFGEPSSLYYILLFCSLQQLCKISYTIIFKIYCNFVGSNSSVESPPVYVQYYSWMCSTVYGLTVLTYRTSCFYLKWIIYKKTP